MNTILNTIFLRHDYVYIDMFLLPGGKADESQWPSLSIGRNTLIKYSDFDFVALALDLGIEYTW